MQSSSLPLLHDRYQVQSLLGRHSGRRTFLALDQHQQQQVVIKVVLFGPDFTWDDLKLFQREAMVLQALDHPAIPRYLDSWEVTLPEGKGFALVQSYIPAPSLQEWLTRGRTFTEVDLTAIATQLLEILATLHHRHPPVVHRDLKPSNILLTDRTAHSPGQVYLVDFGSVQAGGSEGTRTVVGTYGYMPPEQFGGTTTPATDIYALGATLVHLATGVAPSELPQRSLRPHFADRAALSPHLEKWLQRALEPDLDQRWASADSALAALKSKISLQPRPQGNWITTKPHGSKVKVLKTDRELKIILPHQTWAVIPILVFAVPWNGFLVFWYYMSLTSWVSGGWFAALFGVGHLAVGVGLMIAIINCLFGDTRLRITPQSMTLSQYWFLSLRVKVRKAQRQHIQKLQLAETSLQANSLGDPMVAPQINIWAGTKQFTFGGNRRLSRPELEWLAHELSEYLELPIDREKPPSASRP
jgi:hypothetical protein